MIGIGCDIEEGPPPALHLKLDYIDSIADAGGVPLLLPPCEMELPEALEAVDGILFTGGDDYDPSAYGQAPHPAHRPTPPRRHRADLILARSALETSLPILGVCGGLQLLNIALGGDLIQDIDALVPGALRHSGSRVRPASHLVRIEPGTILASLVGSRETLVNSSHHQAVGRAGGGLRASGMAGDGVVEAVEAEAGPAGRFLLAVQWHPERDPQPSNRAIFEGLVEAARAHARERRS